LFRQPNTPSREKLPFADETFNVLAINWKAWPMRARLRQMQRVLKMLATPRSASLPPPASQGRASCSPLLPSATGDGDDEGFVVPGQPGRRIQRQKPASGPTGRGVELTNVKLSMNLIPTEGVKAGASVMLALAVQAPAQLYRYRSVASDNRVLGKRRFGSG
jgi:hypothetical protein